MEASGHGFTQSRRATAEVSNLSKRSWGGSTGLENLVLVVEDDNGLREALEFIFKSERLRAMTAADGMAGLALIRKHRPKVVLLDMYLPHMSGFEVLDEIRNDPVLHNIYVIAVTGMAEDAEELKEMKGKADVIISKPLDEAYVIDLVHSIFEETDDGGLRRHLGGS